MYTLGLKPDQHPYLPSPPVLLSAPDCVAARPALLATGIEQPNRAGRACCRFNYAARTSSQREEAKKPTNKQAVECKRRRFIQARWCAIRYPGLGDGVPCSRERLLKPGYGLQSSETQPDLSRQVAVPASSPL